MRRHAMSSEFTLEQPMRRTFLRGAAAGMMMFALPIGRTAAGTTARVADDIKSIPVSRHYDLTLARTPVNFTGQPASAVTLNGTIPGPLLHFREGDEVSVRLANRLDETTSIHWHGLLVPNAMDGVPGVTFPGVRGGESFEYRFKLRQSGTYWYHSHTILQEPAGFYAPLIIDAAQPEPFQYDRDYVILLSDWTDIPPARVLANLKKTDGFYNYRRQTLTELFAQLQTATSAEERHAIWTERLGWARMRMDPTDFSDGGPEWQYLLQGQRSEDNWTALFAPGERVRLRFINGAAMNFFDVSLPGLDMTVVAADGQNVEPVKVRELRIGNGETYDVIVQPTERRAYTIFAATMARIGFARGTLAPEAGMEAPIPTLGLRPVRKLSEMAGVHGEGEHAQHGSRPAAPVSTSQPPRNSSHASLSSAPSADHSAHASANLSHAQPPAAPVTAHETHDATSVHAATVSATAASAMVRERLSYKDLRSLQPTRDAGERARTIQMDLTGDMNRYFWTINGKRLSEATFFEARVDEPLRFVLINKTMMEHPMHLHGAFFTLENGQDAYLPRKHTVIVTPGETVTLNTAFDEQGGWVFHCHLFYHAATGMVQAVIVK